MKKNIIIGVLSITSLSFLLFTFVQKTQNEELKIQLREAESMAKMYQEQAIVEQLSAIQAREVAEEQAKNAEMAAKRAMEAAEIANQ